MSADPADRLLLRVKEALIRAAMLEDIGPDDIGDDDPLFGEGGLDLDSVDAIELAVELERAFNLRLPDGEDRRDIYASVRTIAAYLHTRGAR